MSLLYNIYIKLFIQETPPSVHSPSSETTESINPFTARIDGVLLPSINRNTMLRNFTAIRVPIEVFDSEPESSQTTGTSKNF